VFAAIASNYFLAYFFVKHNILWLFVVNKLLVCLE